MIKICKPFRILKKGEQIMTNSVICHKSHIRVAALCLAFLFAFSAIPSGVCEETIPEADEHGWVTFFLICNEGMRNEGGNSGNTIMIVSMSPKTGMIKLMPFTWDTFIRYTGYDVLQKIDMPYRNNGPEETMRVFNDNFNMDIRLFMSLNYLNLASLIDAFGGVDVDIEIAERNALNGMVASKKELLLAQADLGLLSQALVEMLVSEYYLDEYGPDTHLNGMQAVGFGWLQYDSVYNCCLRDVQVIAALFKSVGKELSQRVILYTDESGYPDIQDSRRAINLDQMTDDDLAYLRERMSPIFQMAYNNLSEENIRDISNALARTAYIASRQGVNIFSTVKYKILPLEATNPYDLVAGTKGHIINYEENEAAIKEFLFTEEDF